MTNETPEHAIGYTFNDPALLTRALTHSSYAHEHGLSYAACNERMEFLGDAVLELTVSDLLYRLFEDMTEGELTKRRAALVCEPSLAALARSLSIGSMLRLGHGEEITGGRERDSLLSDALEAVFGAIYLDGGVEKARTVIQRLFTPLAMECTHSGDHKTALQEIVQKNSSETAIYAIIHEEGPSHQRIFTAIVSHQGRLLGTGKGRSKKEAEQNAARAALKTL